MAETVYQAALAQALRGSAGATVLERFETDLIGLMGQLVDEKDMDTIRQIQGRAQELRNRVKEMVDARKEQRT